MTESGAELQRVEVVVVDAPVDDVDARLAAGGAHVQDVVAADQVAPLDELDAHLAGEEGVLEVGRVVDAGAEQHDRRIADAGRGRGAQRVEQRGDEAGHRLHLLFEEQPGEHPGQRLPVLDHVGDARRHAQVVLQDAHDAVGAADEVDAGEVDAHARGRPDAGRGAAEVAAREDERVRDDAVAQHVAIAVDVVEERLEGAHPLHDAGLDVVPLVLGDQPRHEVQREDPLLAGRRERDPLLQEAAGAHRAALVEIAGGQQLQGLVQRLRVGTGRAVGVDHLVERVAAIVGQEPVHDPVPTRPMFRELFETLQKRR